MSAAAILTELRGAGLEVRSREGRVVLTPWERVTPRLVELVKEHKPAILAALVQEGARAAPSPSGTPAVAELPPEHQAPALVLPAPHAALESRRAFVVRQLEAHPELPRAFDVADAPLLPEAGPPVSVVLAIRTPQGIVTGELHIPRERFSLPDFVASLDRAAAPYPAPAGATLH